MCEVTGDPFITCDKVPAKGPFSSNLVFSHITSVLSVQTHDISVTMAINLNHISTL